MKKKMVGPLLAILVLVFVFQVAFAAMMPKVCHEDCYDMCYRWCYDHMGFEYCCETKVQCITVCDGDPNNVYIPSIQ